RGRCKSYCVLLTDNLSEETRERLRTIASTNDGFEVAEADLKLRGAGDFFGSRQSGIGSLKIADLNKFRELPAETNAALTKLMAKSPDLSAYPGLRSRAEELLRENGSEGMN
ncbi:MAG: ATP-dependent DNA helicase RecG, partial [Oscillospiraceae bacterium]|nr:ATP-dependent DNA helicase RecG [Oscillospiraceae bacterium]